MQGGFCELCGELGGYERSHLGLYFQSIEILLELVTHDFLSVLNVVPADADIFV